MEKAPKSKYFWPFVDFIGGHYGSYLSQYHFGGIFHQYDITEFGLYVGIGIIGLITTNLRLLMKNLKVFWAICLLLIFLGSSYLCYDYGSKKTEIVETTSGGKGGLRTTYSVSVDTSLSTGYNGAAIGFGIIAGSSLLSLSLLVNTGTTQKEF